MASRYKMLPHAKRFHLSKAFEVYLIGGFGCGKTTALVYEALNLALINKGLAGMLTEPTYQMVDDILVPAIHEALFGEEIEFKYKKSDRIIVLPETESEVWLRSREKPLHLLGPNLAWAGSDEITLDRTEKAHLAILSRVRHPKAALRRLFGTGTPDGLNWFWERYIKNGAPEGVEIIKASTRDNPFLPEEYYKKLLARFPSALVSAYLEGEFIPMASGRVYLAYDPSIHSDHLSYHPNRDLLWAHDFNVDPLCSVILQRQMEKNGDYRYMVIDEIVLRGGALTQDAAKLFVERYGKGVNAHTANVLLYGDASGSARSTSGGLSDYAIIRNILKEHWGGRIIFKVNQSNPSLRDSINAVNTLFQSADGKRRIVLDKNNAKEIHLSLLRTVYDEKTGGILKDGNEHLSDALRYLICREEPILRPRVKIGSGK